MKLPHNKLLATERLLFACLVAWLGIAGFLFGLYRNRLPDWQLVGGIIAFMGMGYIVYRTVLAALMR